MFLRYNGCDCDMLSPMCCRARTLEHFMHDKGLSAKVKEQYPLSASHKPGTETRAIPIITALDPLSGRSPPLAAS